MKDFNVEEFLGENQEEFITFITDGLFAFVESYKVLGTLEPNLFAGTLCMLMEEYCKANNIDILDFVNEIHKSIIDVHTIIEKTENEESD